ncbi:MAG TPA: hypothetical protein VIL46_07430, partial [Gemmataceae bacterium]
TVIRYSDADLAELLDRLSQCYEGGKTFKEFVRLGAVRHPRRALPEDSFAFLRRHTLGRPRDLVIIASELSRNQGALGEPLYRSLVAETSAAVLVPNVFEEMRAFLECLEDRGERLRFLGLLPYNVLTRADVVEVWLRFNGMGPEHAGAFEWDAPGLHHPFWELYGTGLLGVVAREPDGRAAVQRFKQPHDLTDYSRPALPEAEFYLIHPALDGFIRRHRPAGDYHLFQHIVVGHGCPWKEHYRTLHAIERRLFTLPGEDLRESVHAALKEVTAALSAGRPGRARAKAAGSETWGALGERLAAAGHDELRRLLDELIGREA